MVHFARSYLNFEKLSEVGNNGRVERLVHVELGHGDVVLEAPRHGMPQRMDGTEGRVAVLHRARDDAHGDEVVDLREALSLLGHLLVDGVQVLGPPHDLGVDADLLHLIGDDVYDVLQVGLALGARLGHHTADLLVLVGLQVEER